MRHLSRTLLAPLFALLALAAACGDDSSYSGGDNNATAGSQGYLQPCDASAECADGLTCEASVCTRACDLYDPCDLNNTAGYCAQLPGGAFCAPVADGCADPGTPPDFDQCPPGEHGGLAPREDGCLGWGCVSDNACPVHNAPLCEPGQSLVTRHDANGCPYPECEGAANSVQCPDINIPPCPDGQQVVQGTDPDGCPTLTCQPNACPPVSLPECAEGQEVRSEQDENGCPFPYCADVECPVINLPVCPDGQQVVQGTDPNGCPTLTCQPNECPPIAAPDINFCAPGQRLVQTEGPNGCPDWACTFEGCPDFEFPDMCFDGQPPSMRELGPNGCIVLVCAAERSFPCGDNLACSFDTEYCSVVVPGVEGAQTSYSCAPLPDTCLAEPSCACLAEAGAWPENAGDCQDGGGPPGSATLTVTLFAP